MPYITRDMANYAKEKGLSEISSEGSNASATSSTKRKIRQLPNAVDPISRNSDDGESACSGSSSSGSVSSGSSSKSASSGQSKLKTKSSVVSSSKSGSKIKSKTTGSRQRKSHKSRAIIAEQYESPDKDLTFNEKMLKYTIGLLRSNITRLQNLEGSLNIEQNDREFHRYKIDFNCHLVPQSRTRHCDAIFKTFHKNQEFKDFPLCCKVYDRTKRDIDPERSEFLKLLRCLARKHPGIIQTWAIFFDPKKQQILIIQEFFSHDSVETYLQKHSSYPERKAAEIAQQIAKAMDYLGDMGISHRSISPHYIMVAHRDPIQVKLSGFQSAIIYWDLKKENVCLVSCVSFKEKPKEPEFQAPEIYGDPTNEVFDPINADIWSFGACIYFALTKKYPYDFSKNNPKMEDEIKQNVRQTKTSGKCQNFLRRILCTNAEMRMKFDKIGEHPWISRN